MMHRAKQPACPPAALAVSLILSAIAVAACTDLPDDGGGCNYSVPGRENHPINCVDWNQAKTFCAWAGKRLPSEAEWEWAARAGDQRKYPWGNDPIACNRAVTSVSPCAGGDTQPVGSKPAGESKNGIDDMIGNVMEWVEDDWHAGYAGAPADGSAWVDAIRGDLRVLRGGSYNGEDPKDFHSAARGFNNKSVRPVNFGFRCAYGQLPNTDGGTSDTIDHPDAADAGSPEDAGGDERSDSGPSPCGPSPTGKGGGMCEVTGGPFEMGCNNSIDFECEGDEKPYHQVTVTTFAIDKQEVTAEDYGACVLNGGCTSASTGGTCTFGVAGKERHPINCVDWNQAKTFCQWAGKRLPTESEWEKAARGTDQRKYPWGNDSLDCEHVVSQSLPCGVTGTMPVGSVVAGASPYGSLDMAGNVWEWVEDDWHDGYDTNNDGYQPGGDDGKDGPSDGTAWEDFPPIFSLAAYAASVLTTWFRPVSCCRGEIGSARRSGRSYGGGPQQGRPPALTPRWPRSTVVLGGRRGRRSLPGGDVP